MIRIQLVRTIAFSIAVTLPQIAVTDMSVQESTNTVEPHTDRFLWLESIDSEESREWVREQNERTQSRLTSGPEFEELYIRNLEILNSKEKIPMPILCGDNVYNFWTDANNERGVLRRQPIASYLDNAEDWEIVLSIDELAARERTNWVYHDTTWLKPDCERCIIALSPGGSVARVQREFDLVELQFVEDGFNLPLANSKVDWIDQDSIYVGTDFGKNSLTRSGYQYPWRHQGPGDYRS